MKIFVYGTLLKGCINHSYFLKNSKLLGEDIIEGNFTMVSLGGFPGVVPIGKSKIYGEIYEITEDVAKAIDGLEGYHPDPNIAFYDKMKVNTKLGDADMYILDEKYLNYPIIESGNWREWT
jgi:gamma-glutamylcyclotransferase (GGCT)/AIG2-like uncharacterized protein YtfP